MHRTPDKQITQSVSASVSVESKRNVQNRLASLNTVTTKTNGNYETPQINKNINPRMYGLQTPQVVPKESELNKKLSSEPRPLKISKETRSLKEIENALYKMEKMQCKILFDILDRKLTKNIHNAFMSIVSFSSLRIDKQFASNAKNIVKNRSFELNSFTKSQSSEKQIKTKSFLENERSSQKEQNFNEKELNFNEKEEKMRLSEEMKESLKKVQKFENFANFNQIEEICQENFNKEMKRLTKIKNFDKTLKNFTFDNELTVNVLSNFLKIMHQMNENIGNLTVFKENYEKIQKENTENKRNKGVIDTINGILTNLNNDIESLSYEKIRTDISQLLRFESEQILEDKITILKFSSKILNENTEMNKVISELSPISDTLINIKNCEDFQRTFKTLIRDLNKTKTKFMKKEEEFYKNVLKTGEVYENYCEILQNEVSKKNQDAKIEEEMTKLKNEIEKNKSTISELSSFKLENEKMNRLFKEFEKKINQILQKSENNIETKRDIANLQKDKLFIEEKPFSQFFVFASLFEENMKSEFMKELETLNNYIQQVISTSTKERTKSEAKTKEFQRNTQTLLRKVPKFEEIAKSIETLFELSLKEKPEDNIPSIPNISNVKDKNTHMNESSISVRTSVEKIITNKRQRFQSEESKNLRSVNDKETIERDKIMKEIDSYKKTVENNRNYEDKMTEILGKIRNNEEWITDLEALRRERTINQNKNFQHVLTVYDTISKKLKVSKALPERMCNFLTQTLRIYERKMLSQEKRNIEIEKLKAQFLRIDPEFEEMSTFLSNICENLTKINNLAVGSESQENNQKITMLSAENKKLEKVIETERSKSKEVREKLREYEKINKEQSVKLVTLEKQAKSFKERKEEIINSQKNQEENVTPRNSYGNNYYQVQRNQRTQQVSNVEEKKNDDKNSEIQSKIVNLFEKFSIIEKELENKGYLSDERYWENVKKLLETDKVNPNSLRKHQNNLDFSELLKSLLSILSKVSETHKLKTLEERKQNEKTIKSYEKELQKMNKLVSQMEIEIKNKIEENEELFRNIVDKEKEKHENSSNFGIFLGDESDKRSYSLRGSRKSCRSISSDKESIKEKKNKKVIQNFAEQEKTMLEKLSKSENEKNVLALRNYQLEHDLSMRESIIKDLKDSIKILEENLENEYQTYQKEYESWRNKTIHYSNEISGLRSEYEKEFETKYQNVVEKYEKILREKEIEIEESYKEREKIEGEMKSKRQLNSSNENNNENRNENLLFVSETISENETRKTKEEIAEMENKLSIAETENVSLKNQISSILSEIQEKSVEIEKLMSENRILKSEKLDLYSEIESLKKEIETMKKEISEKEEIFLKEKNTKNEEISSIKNELSKMKNEEFKMKTDFDFVKNEKEILRKEKEELLEENERLKLNQNSFKENSKAQNEKIIAEEKQKELSLKEKLFEEKEKILLEKERILEEKETLFVEKERVFLEKLNKEEQNKKEMEEKNLKFLEEEVNKALKNQEEDFNKFLSFHDKEIEDYYWGVVIPAEIKKEEEKKTSEGLTVNENQRNSGFEKEFESKLISAEHQIEKLENELREENKNSLEYKKQIEILESEKENLIKMKDNFEVLIMKLEDDISTLNEECERYKSTIEKIENENVETTKKSNVFIERISNNSSKQIEFTDYLELLKENNNLKIKCILLKSNISSTSSELIAENIEILGRIQNCIYQLVTSLVSKNSISPDFPTKVFAPYLEKVSSMMEVHNKNISKVSSSDIWSESSNKASKTVEKLNLDDFFTEFSRLISKILSEVSSQVPPITISAVSSKETLQNPLTNSHCISGCESSKYKIVLEDIKIMLSEFLKSGEKEYLEMIVKGLEIEDFVESNEQQLQYTYDRKSNGKSLDL